MKLYHYTCHHRHLELQRDLVLPASVDQPAWATDLDFPNRQALGIAAPCELGEDRGEYRYRVTGEHRFVRWAGVAQHLDDAVVSRYEVEPEILVAHWWISLKPSAVVLDPYPLAIR